MEESFFASWTFMALLLGSGCVIALVGVMLILLIVFGLRSRDRGSPPDGDFRP